ncbi:periplasmic heavy metal sensor [Haloarcula sp. Atlit-47R]|uniref:periplasmic heavy metal sensor n=1 Tax=Haloarcula sp. Atlit-47R TaxID=2282132 RepID=UPI0011C38E3B|nr:periplasmic heavy metal sensor [Haloarcula sp. Atlit-47R]
MTLDDPEGELLAHDAVTTDALAAANEAGMASLSAVLHGTNMYSRLEDGLLVGAPSDHQAFDFEPPQPPFVCNGGAELALEENALRADRLDASQVFLNGCSSLMTDVNDGKDFPVHVVLSLLQSARSFIGTYRITECMPHHGALHYALLRSGYTPAERAYLLNQSAVTSGIDHYPYVIAGDPTVDPPTSLSTEYEVEVHGTERCELLISDIDTSIIDTCIPADRFSSNANEFFVRRRADGDFPNGPNDCYFTAFREGDHIRVLIWSWGPFESESLKFTVSTSRTKDDLPVGFEPVENWSGADLTAVPRSVKEAESIQWASPVGKETRKRLQESRVALRDANARLAAERFNADAFRDTVDALLRAGDHLRNARRQLLDEVLADRAANSLQAAYIDNVDTGHPDVADSDCPYCGGPVFLRPTHDSFGEMSRELGICPNCSYAFDVPTNAESCVPELHGSFYGPEAETIPITVTFQNPLDRSTDAVVKLGITHESIPTNNVVGEPEIEVALGPGERHRLQFEIDRDQLMDTVTSAESPNGGSRNVTIDPDWSYFGPQFRGNDARVVEELETQGAADPDIFDGEEVTVEIDGETITVPCDTFEVTIEEKQDYAEASGPVRSTADLDGHYVVEAHVVLQNLEILSGMRTLYLRPT